MKKQTLVIIALAIVLVGGVLAVLLANNNKPEVQTDVGTAAPVTPPGSATPPTSAANNGASMAVAISNYTFGPKDITVKVGTQVTWTNNDSVAHTVTADTASDNAPASKVFSKGQTYSFTFTKAGTYTYHCQPHPYMKGSVTVTE